MGGRIKEGERLKANVLKTHDEEEGPRVAADRPHEEAEALR